MEISQANFWCWKASGLILEYIQFVSASYCWAWCMLIWSKLPQFFIAYLTPPDTSVLFSKSSIFRVSMPPINTVLRLGKFFVSKWSDLFACSATNYFFNLIWSFPSHLWKYLIMFLFAVSDVFPKIFMSSSCSCMNLNRKLFLFLCCSSIGNEFTRINWGFVSVLKLFHAFSRMLYV